MEGDGLLNIQITADSTCDLTAELIEQNHIIITPLTVSCGGETFRDGVDITPDGLYEKIRATGSLASTAAVNVQEYTDVFSTALKGHDAVVHFTISSEMSACYQNACIAAQELGNVYVVDSRNLSTGIGHLVLDACQMAAEGMDAADIQAELTARREKLDVSFVVDTLEYLRKGGRCSALAAMGANILKLHPCIFVKDGQMGVGRKYRGKLIDCVRAYVRDRLAEPESVDTRRIFITDSGVDEDIRAAAEEEVRRAADFAEIIHTRAGCTVSSHCGPGTLGVLFYRK